MLECIQLGIVGLCQSHLPVGVCVHVCVIIIGGHTDSVIPHSENVSLKLLSCFSFDVNTFIKTGCFLLCVHRKYILIVSQVTHIM